MHWLCKPCFRQYATVTVEAGDHTSITCCVPQCGALFATDAAASGLGDLDRLKMAERENARNQKVALAAKAVLRCACGTVGVVLEEDMSADGRITCPGCSHSYCAKCGNDAHPGECPPPAKTLEWMSKHGKPCPNCGDLIQKDGGCQHMHCAPPGGCGHHFCWGCMRPYPQQCHGCGRN
jgi:ariadne-1